MVILGMSGAGKSNDVTVVVEELGQYDAPLLVFDQKPEYGPLCERPFLTNPARAGAQNVTPENAHAVARRIMQKRLHVVVDLTSYRNDADAALVMTGLIEGVKHWQESLSNDQRVPCTFVLDEAHYWLPENENQSTIRGRKHPQTGQSLLAHMQQVFFTMSKMGRSLGMGMVVSTQRPADVDKRLISSAEWRLLLKALEPTDLKVYCGYGLSDEQAMALNPKMGEAYVMGPEGIRGVYHLRRRYSPDVAKSPGLANIRATPPTDSGSPQAVNSVNAPEAMEQAEGYTPDEEMLVVLAYAELCKAGGPVTRRAILAYLEEHRTWNRRHYTRVIKPVCDKRGLAVSES